MIEPKFRLGLLMNEKKTAANVGPDLQGRGGQENDCGDHK